MYCQYEWCDIHKREVSDVCSWNQETTPKNDPPIKTQYAYNVDSQSFAHQPRLLFVNSNGQARTRSSILVLDPRVRIRVDEAAAAARAPLAAEHAAPPAAGGGLVPVGGARQAEEDRGQQEAGHGSPGESESPNADVGLAVGGAEAVAAFDDPGAA